MCQCKYISRITHINVCCTHHHMCQCECIRNALTSRELLEVLFFWVITQQVVVISYRRFGTTYRFHIQGSRVQVSQQPTNHSLALCFFVRLVGWLDRLSFWTLELEMGQVCSPETSVINYRSSLRNNPEHSYHLLRSGILRHALAQLLLYCPGLASKVHCAYTHRRVYRVTLYKLHLNLDHPKCFSHKSIFLY